MKFINYIARNSNASRLLEVSLPKLFTRTYVPMLFIFVYTSTLRTWTCANICRRLLDSRSIPLYVHLRAVSLRNWTSKHQLHRNTRQFHLQVDLQACIIAVTNGSQ